MKRKLGIGAESSEYLHLGKASCDMYKIEQTARRNPLAISRIDEPQAIPREMFSRSPSVSVSGERRREAGAIPPCCANIN
jgi:hypothetical protein